MCHVGGFGPQLTPYGRDFKLKGYTDRVTRLNVPLSAMAVASYVRTAKAQPEPPAAHFATNDNVALDQASVFFAGGFGEHVGAFAQATYDGVSRTFAWDNLDLRLTTRTQIRDRDVVLGLSLNNSPGVQDAWNTLPAWGFPYTDSALAPAPSAAPLLAGPLAQTTLGVTGYAWISSALYLEAGAYGSPSARILGRLGADPADPGDLKGLAPYGRVAFQTKVRAGVLEVGAVALRADIRPGLDRTTGLVDRYTDLGLDASFQRAFANHDVLSLNARWLHERRKLAATCALAGSEDPGCADGRLDDLRFDVAYYWRQKIGLTVAAFDTFGSANAAVFAANRTLKPDSSGVILQVDGTPFGDRPQPARRLNLRLGLQYTHYFEFEGARRDFASIGRDAGDNDTLRVFTWVAF
jgi:hypothetical protein